MLPNPKDLVASRDELYGDAYKLTGVVLAPLNSLLSSLLRHEPTLWWCWLMVFNKLIRALFNPRHVDSWADMAGYAELAKTECLGTMNAEEVLRGKVS